MCCRSSHSFLSKKEKEAIFFFLYWQKTDDKRWKCEVRVCLRSSIFTSAEEIKCHFFSSFFGAAGEAVTKSRSVVAAFPQTAESEGTLSKSSVTRLWASPSSRPQEEKEWQVAASSHGHDRVQVQSVLQSVHPDHKNISHLWLTASIHADGFWSDQSQRTATAEAGL